MENNEKKPGRATNDGTSGAVNPDNIPLVLGCLLDDVAEVKSIVGELYKHLGIGAAGTKPVTIKEAAEYLSITPRAVNKMVRERLIPYYERNGTIYFFEKELMEWIKATRVTPFDEKYNKMRNRNYNVR